MSNDSLPKRTDIQARIDAVRQRMTAACKRVGRDPSEMKLVAVTKNVSLAAIREAYIAGISCFGENRVQEAATKIPLAHFEEFRDAGTGVSSSPQWHLVGHLQTNKAKKAIELFEVIQSLDSLHLAETLQRHAAGRQRIVEVLIEVNTSGEPAKFGVPPAETLQLAKAVAALPNLQLIGLMTIGALTDRTEIVRRCFRRLRELYQEIAATNLPGARLRHLSMGMTDDFELAIEEGSTMVRIGRAIFGDAPRKERS
jgi:hypothetical protein